MVDADDEVSGDFRVEGVTVARFLDPENAFDPGNDFVRGRIGGVDDAVADAFGERAFEGGEIGGERGVVFGSDIEAVVVLEENRPLRGVEGGSEALGVDQKVFFGLWEWGQTLGVGIEPVLCTKITQNFCYFLFY
ncbi:hypothetical protein U1Q18_024648 [Sarracenia purpurea var. burkii]